MTDLATGPNTDVEIDSDLLEEAQRQISAPSANAAINEALRRLTDSSALNRIQRRQVGGTSPPRYGGSLPCAALTAGSPWPTWW